MNIKIVKVDISQINILINLVKFYCYEWSQYNGIEINENGEFEFEHHIHSFFNNERRHAFFIMADGKIAGFVLIDDDFDYDKNADYAISEFFIMHTYRRNGIGKRAAIEILKMFPGTWEIKMHPANTISMQFWKSVVSELTAGDYTYIQSYEQARYGDGSKGNIISFRFQP